MFLDEATITVIGGNGGNGSVSWRREKYVAKGGPDGGDGGDGGNIVIRAEKNTDTLSAFRAHKRFTAQSGGNGSRKNKRGQNGKNRILHVSPGTTITARDGEVLGDLVEDGDQIIIARGGRGGYGNAHFTSSVRQRPDFSEKGEPGESVSIHLELKIVADVGIIGYPSVGKSTLISVISAAKPKIAAYEFTTLVPNLGVVQVHDRSFVVCDIPGLIKGASEGKGLGDTFLRHIERCGVLVHLLDIGRALDGHSVDAVKLLADYHCIRHELTAYSPTLTDKQELVVLSKSDLTTGDLSGVTEKLAQHGINVFAIISSVNRDGIDSLVQQLLPIVIKEREKKRMELPPHNIPVLQPHLVSDAMSAYTLTKDDDGTIRILGKRLEQFTKMTDFGSEGGVRRFRDVLERIGLLKAIVRERKSTDAHVYIGSMQIDDHL